MFLNDEKIMNALGEVGFIRNNNCYFLGQVVPGLGSQVAFGIFASFARDFSGYIINQTEEGIGVIPISNATGKPLVNVAYFLPQNNIINVVIENGGLFYYKKITITDSNNKNLIFKVVKNVMTIKKHKGNVKNFISMYQK